LVSGEELLDFNGSAAGKRGFGHHPTKSDLQGRVNHGVGRSLTHDPKAYVDGQVPNGTGFVHRGVAAWRHQANGGKLRLFMNSRYRLISLEAATGLPCADGKARVDLSYRAA